MQKALFVMDSKIFSQKESALKAYGSSFTAIDDKVYLIISGVNSIYASPVYEISKMLDCMPITA